MKSIITLFIASSLLLIGCTKANRPILDEEAPEVYIFAPKPGTSLTVGQEFQLRAELAENQEIHQYMVVLRMANQSFEFSLLNKHLDAPELQIDELIALPNLPVGAYELEVSASDHSGNTQVTSVEVSLE